MKKYYLIYNDEQKGPFSLEELMEQGVNEKTLVWHEDLPDWKPAGELDELRNFNLRKAPPPIKKNEVESTKTNNQNVPKKRKKRWVSVLKISLWFIGVIIFLSLLIDYFTMGDITENYSEKVFSVEVIERAEPLRFLSIEAGWYENLLSTKFVIKGSITNAATVAKYKDIVIRVFYYSKTDTVIKEADFVLYEFYPANSTKEFELRVPYMSNATSLGWSIIQASPY